MSAFRCVTEPDLCRPTLLLINQLRFSEPALAHFSFQEFRAAVKPSSQPSVEHVCREMDLDELSLETRSAEIFPRRREEVKTLSNVGTATSRRKRRNDISFGAFFKSLLLLFLCVFFKTKLLQNRLQRHPLLKVTNPK